MQLQCFPLARSCVTVPGTTSAVLFLDANRVCSAGWLAPLYLVLVCLVVFALVLPWIAQRLHRARITGKSPYARILLEPYTESCYYWEAVLLAQRLALSFLSVFALEYPVLRCMLSVFVCLACCVANMALRPFHDQSAHKLQTVLQLCLVILAMCSIVPAHNKEASFQEGGPESAASRKSSELLVVAEVLFTLVLPIAAIVTSLPRSAWLNPIAVLFR
jgi:hypothetical protein